MYLSKIANTNNIFFYILEERKDDWSTWNSWNAWKWGPPITNGPKRGRCGPIFQADCQS